MKITQRPHPDDQGGSSSIKFALFAPVNSLARILEGAVERMDAGGHLAGERA